MDEDKRAFLAAYDKYAESILKHVYFRVSEWKLAEDLTQETFLKAWQYIASGEHRIDNFKTFLYKVAGNLVIDHYRQKAKAPILLDGTKEFDIAGDPPEPRKSEENSDWEEIEKHLFELGDEYRQILVYRYIDGLSIKEISELSGKTPDNVSVIIHRGLKMLKEKMEYV